METVPNYIWRHILNNTSRTNSLKLLNQNNIKINNTELYEIPKPKPPPPPPPTVDKLIEHKQEKPLWSALGWLKAKYKPIVKDNTPNWKECNLLGNYSGTVVDFQNHKQRLITNTFICVYFLLYHTLRDRLQIIAYFETFVFLNNV